MDRLLSLPSFAILLDNAILFGEKSNQKCVRQVKERLRPRRQPDPGPPGVGSRCTGIHLNTAGLRASAAMGLDGRHEVRQQ
jgi:hypothetical protein